MRTLTTIALIFLLNVGNGYGAQERFTAGTFWTAFRDAVLVNNEKKLVAMTKLPLEVHGISDSTPVKYYERAQVPSLFNKILMQPEFIPIKGRIVPKTLLRLIYEKKSITQSDLAHPDFFRFYQLEFQRIKGQWSLTRAYLDE